MTTPKPTPFPFTVGYCSFQTMPRRLLLPPCSLVHQLAGKTQAWQDQQPKSHGCYSSSRNKPCSCQCLLWRDGIRQQVLSTGPGPSPHGQQQYVPLAPTATNSKEKPSECNFLMYLQFLSEELKLKAVTPVSPQSISVQCLALQGALFCALLQGCRRQAVFNTASDSSQLS